MSGSNLRTRNTTDQDRRARLVLAAIVLANQGSAEQLAEFLDMLALRPGQESGRVSSMEVRRNQLSPVANGGGTVSDKRGDHYF